ncbi:receptor accessory protein 6 [Phyllostomus discolor]|uniref:Receptor accessory protein 6 n=1 Tax=Phyllostomus discolor TaxID=89673 RepID=A0A834DXT0_9CHIR|nr:receptor accessory protein 6 [Phyllostomus discolor]
MAHLLGSVQPIRACRILQRSTPVLVPFLLRGQVRLPVVLHDSRAVERGSHVVSPRHTSAVSKTSRGRGQHYERPQRASPGRGSRNNPGRQSKRNPAPAGQVKSLPSPRAGLLNRQLKGTLHPKSSTDPSTNSAAQTATVPSAPGSTSRTTLGQSRATGAASGSKLPGKSQAQPGLKANSSSQPQAPGQQHSRPSVSSLGPSQPAHRLSGSSKRLSVSSKRSPGSSQRSPGSPQQSPGSSQQPSTPSSQGTPTVPCPSGTNISMQLPQKTSNGPEELAPKASKSSDHQQKGSPTQAPTSTSVPELPVACQSESSLDFTSESTTEVTCSWPHHCPWLQYLHCWRMKHLAC